MKKNNVLLTMLVVSVFFSAISYTRAEEIPITPTFLPAAEIVRLPEEAWQKVELLPGIGTIGLEWGGLSLDATFYAPRKKRGGEKWWRIEYLFEGRKLFEIFEIEREGKSHLIWARMFTSPREWVWIHENCVEIRFTQDGLWLKVSQAYVRGWKEIKIK